MSATADGQKICKNLKEFPLPFSQAIAYNQSGMVTVEQDGA